MRLVMILISLMFASSSFAGQPKEWTFLLYLNGNNNLDPYGAKNLNQLEKVGSSDKINIVVQWASLKNGKTQRLLIQKDADAKVVTSPILQDLGNVDMGDWHSLVDFVQWGSANFPAQHYFVDVWDHGSGWHSLEDGAIFKDISTDDTSGHHMTTKQLAQALSESAKTIGHKIDLYASDACLMAMAEIAAEVADSVEVYAGSEELEPGKGWPYDTIFARWNAMPSGSSAKDVAKILSEEYAKSYSNSKSDKVTFSAFDLNQIKPLEQSIRALSASLKSMSADEADALKAVAKKSQHFNFTDYVDFMDFVTNMKAAKVSRINAKVYASIESSVKNFIVTSNNIGYPNAHGMSIWIPSKSKVYSENADLYSQLIFDQQTHWSDVVAKLIGE